MIVPVGRQQSVWDRAVWTTPGGAIWAIREGDGQLARRYLVPSPKDFDSHLGNRDAIMLVPQSELDRYPVKPWADYLAARSSGMAASPMPAPVVKIVTTPSGAPALTTVAAPPAAAPVASGDGPVGYARLVGEDSTYTFTTPMDVAYGAAGKFVFRSAVMGTVRADNATFGDPIVGVTKALYARPAVAGTARSWWWIAGVVVVALVVWFVRRRG